MSTNVVSSLIDKLEAKREDEGLSSRKFAGKLGISSELWRLIVTGERRITDKTATHIKAAYPELEDDLYIFLSGSVDMSLPSSDNSTAAPEASPDGSTGGFGRWLRYLVLRIRHPRQARVGKVLKSKSR